MISTWLAVGSIVFSGATLIDGNGGPPVRNAWIVTKGDRIFSVSKQRPAVPPDAKLVDVRGKYIIPGLFDMHTHIDDPELVELNPKPEEKAQWLPLFVLNGVTSCREMAGNLELMKGFRRRISSGDLFGPRLWFGGPLVDGPKPMWPESIAVSTPEEGRAVVRDLKSRGADFIKAYSLLPRDAFFAICDEGKKQKIPVCGHVPIGVTNAEASEAGENSIEHMLYFEKELANPEKVKEMRAKIPNFATLDRYERFRRNNEIYEQCYDSGLARSLFAKFKANGTWIDPTLTVMYRNVTFGEDQAEMARRTEFVPAYVRDWWNPNLNVHLKDRNENLVAGMKVVYKLYKQAIPELKRAGIPLLVGSDMGGNPNVSAGWGVHDELRLLVEAGLTPMDALVAATSNPAKYLGVYDKLGSIEPGKLADLVILDADPLANIRNVGKIAGVVRNGEFLERGEVKRRLSDLKKLVAHRL